MKGQYGDDSGSNIGPLDVDDPQRADKDTSHLLLSISLLHKINRRFADGRCSPLATTINQFTTLHNHNQSTQQDTGNQKLTPTTTNTGETTDHPYRHGQPPQSTPNTPESNVSRDKITTTAATMWFYY